jgi:hypothetical protein
MLLIAVSLVPWWRSVAAGEFRAWFVAHSFRLGQVMVPLGVAATAAAVATLLVAVVARGPLMATAVQLGALLGVLGVYFGFNKPINDQIFADGALPEARVRTLLRRWAAWHWVRVGLGLVAFVAAS